MATKKVIKEYKESQALKALIKRPRFTEKTTSLAEKNNCYTFDVEYSANKQELQKAIEALYGVTPKSIRLVKHLPRKGAVRSKIAHIKGYKKAYVYLKKGDTLTLM